MRICKYPACGTILSQYNKREYCWMHYQKLLFKETIKDSRFREPPRKRKIVTITCLNCNKRKEVEMVWYKKAKYCSLKCYYEDRKAKKEIKNG